MCWQNDRYGQPYGAPGNVHVTTTIIITVVIRLWIIVNIILLLNAASLLVVISFAEWRYYYILRNVTKIPDLQYLLSNKATVNPACH